MENAKERGRRAYAGRAWGDAYEALTQAAAEGLLDADDAELLAFSAALSGNESASFEAFDRLHQIRLDAGDVRGAARAAFWAAMRSFWLGEMARGSGWVARAQRLVDQAPGDCVECGYVRLPLVFRLTAAGDYESAREAARHAADIGVRHGDRDLTALGRAFEGRALIRHGRLSEGLPLLDEAMVAVTSDELSPIVTGIVYCAVIAACQQSYAIDRAREWTEALSGWCRAQPQLVSFAGPCLIHRSEAGDFVLLPKTPGFTMSGFEPVVPSHIDLQPTRGRASRPLRTRECSVIVRRDHKSDLALFSYPRTLRHRRESGCSGVRGGAGDRKRRTSRLHRVGPRLVVVRAARTARARSSSP